MLSPVEKLSQALRETVGVSLRIRDLERVLEVAGLRLTDTGGMEARQHISIVEEMSRAGNSLASAGSFGTPAAVVVKRS